MRDPMNAQPFDASVPLSCSNRTNVPTRYFASLMLDTHVMLFTVHLLAIRSQILACDA